MSLLVREAGLQSQVVDFGRERGRALGVPVGGAADRAALALGNALVGNAPAAAALEVAFAGPTLEALHPTACVLFGAPFQSSVNGNPIPPGVTFTLEAGDVLRVGGTPAGARAYLCVAGGFDAPEVLGSRSALESVRPGEVLTCPPSRTEPRGLPFCVGRPQPPTPANRGREGAGETSHPLPTSAAPRNGTGGSGRDGPRQSGSPESDSPSLQVGGRGVGLLRVLDGPQRDWFPDDRFFAQEYEVSPASNRMGLRLKGEPLARKPGELTSEAVAPGAVQVTNDGLPIALGVDGQTIGGYPKVAHVVRADLDLLAQLRPGERVRFVRVSLEEAEAAARARDAFLREWVTRLRVAERRPVVG